MREQTAFEISSIISYNEHKSNNISLNVVDVRFLILKKADLRSEANYSGGRWSTFCLFFVHYSLPKYPV